MIATYSEYIDRFLIRGGRDGFKSPGEHHFVATYLLPKLYSLNNIVPDYVNPDGTKGIVGDVVYFRNGYHHFGIEVKFEVIRLTKNEFNSWIVDTDSSNHPNLFLGVGTAGIIILPWADFRNDYLKSINQRVTSTIEKGYGPQKAINELFKIGESPGYLKKCEQKSEYDDYESRFLNLLNNTLNC